MKAMRITMGKGFKMLFPNGVLASVQWGTSNYCENRSLITTTPEDVVAANNRAGSEGSDTAEVCAWLETPGASMDDRNSIIQKLYPGNADIVIGWLPPADVVEFLNKCMNYPYPVEVTDDGV
jgi:hypothetical protein